MARSGRKAAKRRKAGKALAIIFARSLLQQLGTPHARHRRRPRCQARGLGASSIGAFAVGAFSVGGAAAGALAIGRLAVGRAKVGSLIVDDLKVGRLQVEQLTVTNRAQGAGAESV